MKYIYIAIFLFFSLSTLSQNCIEFGDVSVDFLEISPKWIKNHGYKKVIEREYLTPPFKELHLVNTMFYNDSGYIEKKINGLSYPKSDDPDEEDFFSSSYYNYEMIDSFLYQKQLTVRKFDENGRLNKPDTLPIGYLNEYNIYQKKFQTHPYGNVYEYTYNNKGQLTNINKPSISGKEIELKYKNNQVNQIELRFTKEEKSSFADNGTFKYEYNSDGLVSKSSLINQNFHFKYYYDKEYNMIRKELLIGNRIEIVYKYEYLK